MVHISINDNQPNDPSPPQTDSGELAADNGGNVCQVPTALADGRLESGSQSPEACRSIGERGLPTSAIFGSRRPSNSSYAAEDSSAYAEALEGRSGREDGCVPFYPGMTLLHSTCTRPSC